MNVLGHTFVALAGGRNDPEYLLGAVLPDLAPMAGVRLRRAGTIGALGDGVRCHVRADAAFHAHRDFRAGSGALRRSLVERRVASGPARAVAHAGWELLLDGTLVGSSVEQAFHAVLAVGDRAAAALTPHERPRWEAFLDRARTAGRLRFDDPRWVADRLHVMLERRPRLRLPPGQVGTVADVLGGHVDAVQRSAAVVLDDTAHATRALTDDETGGHRCARDSTP